MMAVQGSIQTRTYEDKEGNKRKAVEILADNVFFAGSKNTPASHTSTNTESEEPQSSIAAAPVFSQGVTEDFAVVDDNEDLPF